MTLIRTTILWTVLGWMVGSLCLAGDDPIDDASKSQDPQAVQRAVSKTQSARNALRANDTEGAIDTLEEVQALVPTSRNARWNAAWAHARRAEDALHARAGAIALDESYRAVDLHPERIRYQVLLGRAQLLEGRGAAAKKTVLGVTDLDPNYGPALLLLADVTERQGELDESIDALRRFLALYPHEIERLDKRIQELERRRDTESTYLSHASGNFDVRYSEDAKAETVRLAITLLENAYSQVTADLGMQPKTKATVVLYTDEEFQSVTGAHGWVAGLYRNGTLRLPLKNLTAHRSQAARILTHEFTHHVLRERSPRLPSWLHEGIAQFLERPPSERHAVWKRVNDRMKPHKKDVLTADQLRRIQISSTRNGNTASFLYAQSHAIVGWLIELRGLTSFADFTLALNDTRDLDRAAEKIYGGSWTKLVNDWKQTL